MFQLQRVSPEAIIFTDLDGQSLRLDLPTLFDLSTEARDVLSGQRRPNVALASDEAIANIAKDSTGWTVTLTSGATLTVTHDRLAEFYRPHLWQVMPRPWSGAEAQNLPVYDYRAFQAEPEVKHQALLQLAVYGFVRLTGAPAVPGGLENLATAFGCLRETNYGRIFDVRTKVNASNLADTALALAPHTDNPYRLSPPEIQMLHCLTAAGRGGQSLLVDGLEVCEAVRAEGPEDHDLLSRVPVRFAWADATTRLEAEAPVIALKADGAFDRLRYNPRSMQKAITDGADETAAWLAAMARLHDRLTAPGAGLTFAMQPGDVVIMDNRRVLHGRTEFDTSAEAERYLQGAYADMDGVYSTLRRLTEARVAEDLQTLETMFADESLSQSYGEAISIRDHMLQTAEGALARQLGPELVAAALLHDIGWGRADPHEATGAAIVAPVLGETVASLIRQHVAAKRYLVAMRPDYAARLSAASVQTLRHQGGPMSAEECRAFEALPDFQLCLELRYLDEGGKDLSPPTSRFSDYRPLLKSLMLRKYLGVDTNA